MNQEKENRVVKKIKKLKSIYATLLKQNHINITNFPVEIIIQTHSFEIQLGILECIMDIENEKNYQEEIKNAEDFLWHLKKNYSHLFLPPAKTN